MRVLPKAHERPTTSPATTEAPKRAPRRRPIGQGDVVTLEQYDAEIARTMSEDVWRGQIRRFAKGAGFDLAYHTYDSRRSDAGWPDDVLMHQNRNRLILMEAKRDSGKLSAGQVVWLDAMARFRDMMSAVNTWVVRLEIYGAVRPSDRDRLIATLFGPGDAMTRRTETYRPLHQWCVSEICGWCNVERSKVRTGR